MKKIVYILVALFMTLFVACTQEESVETLNGDSRVNFSLKLPSSVASTRAAITVPASYKMRCILEVWTADDEPMLKHREEQAIEGGATPSIDFKLQAGDYTCLIWTDFIAADAAEEQITTEDGLTYTRYADTFYNTENLKSVTIKDVNGANLFDTDACDAFFARIDLEKKSEAVAQTVTLTRPLAKLVFKEDDAEQFSLLTKLRASYQVPSGFNVATGEPLSSMQSLNFIKKDIDKDNAGRVLFSNYVFTPSDAKLEMETISFQFSLGSTVLNREIPAGAVALTRNQQLNVKGELIGDGTFVPEEPEPSELPQVGDFFYADGSWSSSYKASGSNPCIGVVFAVANDGGVASADTPENYPGTGLKEIKGWVVAAYDLRDDNTKNNLKPRKEGVVIPEELKGDMDDIQGFLKTELLKQQTLSDYPIAEMIVNYQNDEKTKAPATTSGWYWGAVKQYEMLAKVYATVSKEGQMTESLPVRESLLLLENAGIGELFPVGGNERRHWYSTATDKIGKGLWAGFVCFGVETKDYGGIEDDWWPVTNSGNARAILTF
ncbi:DUF6562 domain-containing protein [Bacteroides caecimuris]|uniref:DUF6562 domain-containing protein n=2 Tax=Bacteroides caecimuris TaxID=1796613 RepID=UPI0024301B6D|nr:DUF6562 domain-containing protein [Bacteroides caecimuris]